MPQIGGLNGLLPRLGDIPGGREPGDRLAYARGPAFDSQTGCFAIGCCAPRCVRCAATAASVGCTTKPHPSVVSPPSREERRSQPASGGLGPQGTPASSRRVNAERSALDRHWPRPGEDTSLGCKAYWTCIPRHGASPSCLLDGPARACGIPLRNPFNPPICGKKLPVPLPPFVPPSCPSCPSWLDSPSSSPLGVLACLAGETPPVPLHHRLGLANSLALAYHQA